MGPLVILLGCPHQKTKLDDYDFHPKWTKNIVLEQHPFKSAKAPRVVGLAAPLDCFLASIRVAREGGLQA